MTPQPVSQRERVAEASFLGIRIQKIYDPASSDGARQGDPYFVRYRLLKTPWGQARLHVIWRADAAADLHIHGNAFWTFPLNRGYWEEVPQDSQVPDGKRRMNHVRALCWAFRGADYAHRVVGPRFPVLTLVWIARRT